MKIPMKIRVYSPQYPFPPSEGAFQVAADQLRVLAEAGHEVELVTWLTDKTSEPPHGIRHRLAGRPAGVTPARRLKRVVSSFTGRWASPELFYYPLSARGPEEEADLGIYHFSFAAPWFGTGRTGNEKKRAVFFLNLESDLFEQRARSAPALTAWLHRLNARKLHRNELALADQADEIWFLSSKDQDDYVKRLGKKTVTRLTPPTYPPELFEKRKAARKSNGRGPVLGFIGVLSFGPNRQGALWLLNELAPRLQARGFQGKLLIAGREAGEDLQALAARYAFVEMPGFVKDIESFWSELDFMLVPHIEGSGIRIKLIEALASGLPVLCTPPALQGTAPDVREHPRVFSSADADQWVERIFHPTEDNAPPPPSLNGGNVYSFLGSAGL